jgi:hypothetical protein
MKKVESAIPWMAMGLANLIYGKRDRQAAVESNDI